MDQQLSGQIRIFSTALAAYLAGRGIFFDAVTWNVILFAVFTASMQIWSGLSLTPTNQKVAVASMPNTLVVETTPASSDAHVASQLATMPEVVQVTTTPQVAKDTLSTKIVAP